jgi:hypothetical protein
MAYRIEQTDEYLGNDQWNWRAWIEATPEGLNSVESVAWYLHPTYAVAVVETRDRCEKFEIQRRAWGRFLLQAELRLLDGGTRKLRKQLQLWYPDQESPAPAKESPDPSASRINAGAHNVFVSYSMDDRQLAGAVISTLSRNGYKVLDPSQLAPGSPWQLSVQKMLRESDLVLGISSSEFASPNVVTELNNAHRAEKPILTLVSPGVGSVFGLDPGMSQNEADFSDPNFEDRLIDLVQQQID